MESKVNAPHGELPPSYFHTVWSPEEIDDHPVVRNRARLPTPPIRDVFDVVSLATIQRAPGCCFVAHPRFGKTFAIRLLAAQLQASFPNLPVIVVNAKDHPRFSEPVLYGELLQASGHLSSGGTKADTLRKRLVRYLWNMAAVSNSDRIVLFVDEAQNWQEPALSCLRDISNDLDLLGDISLVSVFFGQKQLASVRAALLEMNRTDLIGRFLIKLYEFPGIASLSALDETTKCYDDPAISEFPEKSGVSYSQFFMPLAFQSGWRLAHEAGTLWNEFSAAAAPYGGLGEVGMQWVAGSIRSFFLTQLQYDHAGFEGSSEQWKAAVRESNFTDYLGVTYNPNHVSLLTPLSPLQN